MPRSTDPRPVIRTAEPTRNKKSRSFHDKLGQDEHRIDNYFTSENRAAHSGEVSPPSLSPSVRSSLGDRPEYSRLPLSEENLRKFEKSATRRTYASAHMRKKTSPTKKDKRQEKEDRNSHPLNLPPDELRRLSAAIAREEISRAAMDGDDIQRNGSSPTPMESPPATPSNAAPGAVPETANGTPNGINGKAEKSPTPPPHKEPMKPKVDAEACKAAGNKFFKAKDYLRAIDEYTKGLTSLKPSWECSLTSPSRGRSTVESYVPIKPCCCIYGREQIRSCFDRFFTSE